MGEFKAFVYGRRLGQTTKYDLPVHGVALEGRLALHSSPVRQLEPGEVRQRGLDAQGIYLSVGGEVEAVAHSMAALAVETRHLQRESGRGPYPAQRAMGKAPAGLPPGTAAFPITPGWTIGGKRLLVIRVDFSDHMGGPFDFQSGTTITTNIIGPVMNSANQFIVDNSQNQTSFETTMVPAVLRLPRTKVAYASSPVELLRDDAVTASAQYDQANGNSGLYNPANYDFDTVVFSRIDGAAWEFSGLANVGAKGMWMNGQFGFRVLTHELGHNYGLQHASRWDVAGTDPIDPAGTYVDYGDAHDMMGGNPGSQPLHFNEWFKVYLGWMGYRNAQANGTYRLFRHDHASATLTGDRAITVGQQGDRAYWLGYRRQDATNGFLNSGVEIRWGMQPADVNTNTGLLQLGITNDMDISGSVLLNMTPGVANFSQHPLPLNQTFYDSNNFVFITLWEWEERPLPNTLM